MKNLTEQLNRIKTLMLVKEQCGADLGQCETDLENKGYTVYTPNEKKDVCDDNPIIKCVYNVLNSNGILDLIINSTQSSSKDCYVLSKSVKKEGGLPKYHFTFYADGQVYLSVKLKTNNNNDKLVFVGKFECDESSNNLTINRFKYQGVWGGSSIIPKDEKVKNDSGESIEISSTESAKLNVPVGDLMYKNLLSWLFNYDVTTNNTLLTKIKSLLTT